MTAVIVRKLRDLNEQVLAQVLIYPVTQFVHLDLPSYQHNLYGPILTRNHMIDFFTLYWFGKEADDEMREAMTTNTHTPYVLRKKLVEQYGKEISVDYPTKIDIGPKEHNEKVWKKIEKFVLSDDMLPLMSSNLTDLPPAFVHTGYHDVLCYEGLMYVKRLEESGNKVHNNHKQAGFHCSFTLQRVLKESVNLHQDIAKFIKNQIA